MQVSKAVKDNLKKLKKDVNSSWMYSHDNFKRFHEFRKYVYKESINDQQRAFLIETQRPLVEFNILEAYLSRLLGEFSMHEPSIEVSPADGAPVNEQVI